MKTKGSGFIKELERVIQERSNSNDIEKSYTHELLTSGKDRIAKKVIEESGELAVAYLNDATNKDEIIWESADLLYHMMVLLQSADVTMDDVSKELEKRHKPD
ncbi:MAG: phosphoribosyl-ATP diphosphatase [Gammaproteobacteria bacterium]|jgi:phosphoribosyl-ATP pyrophosphohydrolase/phosphoribosyl-AMP cyclohydrolase|nr:phosphoribosyl-ATP diphosphatase [Gammaproteobacteria bacterium]MBQ08276.1 phosphoribosyl-ATP diphosphatase [Gammaproteobacteria bacterium]MDP6147300.1 phosphoribosyl-ATP diphosphatase [Gammaproteobacteria bacterium]HJL80787.1 phosphoribosyl-ATP diphosphatase [Gammaproteobacteria bacterium]HJM09335.1 phosphoribosyl-ATP diphosphatase [Gammaproteobacteria bacterium]|tara:strand:- start:7269 stop:7577 length:309 start_codon:yes stop_codon:yes gene_type:complete